MQEHYKGQKDPACLLTQKRSSIWAGLQLPSLVGIRFLVSAFLLTTVLQLMASSEARRFTVSWSPGTATCSPRPFPDTSAAAGLRQTQFLWSELRGNSRVSSRQLLLLSKSACSKPPSSPSSAVSTAGAHTSHVPHSKGMGTSLCQTAMPQVSSS